MEFTSGCVMIRVQAVLVQHWPCDGERPTNSHRIFQIKIHWYEMVYLSYPLFFSIDVCCCRYHISHEALSLVVDVILVNRWIRYEAGWICSPLPKQSQDLVSCLSGFVMSSMTPPYPTFMFGTIDNLFYRQHRDVGTLLAPKNYQIPWEFFYSDADIPLTHIYKLSDFWEFFYNSKYIHGLPPNI